MLERGGVIGGSSAGATIQGDYLVRGAIAGSEIVMTPEPEHEHGFAFLRKVAIDQHINTRNRWDDIIPVIKKYPNLLGIGLSEGTAIVVTGDRFEVIGKWKVAIHDNTRAYQPWEKPYYVLSPGDVYNMKTRTIEKYGTGVLAPATRAGEIRQRQDRRPAVRRLESVALYARSNFSWCSSGSLFTITGAAAGSLPAPADSCSGCDFSTLATSG